MVSSGDYAEFLFDFLIQYLVFYVSDFKNLWGNIVKGGPKTNKDSSAQDQPTTTPSSDDEPDPVTAAPLEQMVKRRSTSVC